MRPGWFDRIGGPARPWSALRRRKVDIRAEGTVSGTDDYVGLISGVDPVARRHIHKRADRRAASERATNNPPELLGGIRVEQLGVAIRR